MIALLTLLAAASLAPSAPSTDAADAPPVVSVRTSDLRLSTPEDTRKLDMRLKRAATAACDAGLATATRLSAPDARYAQCITTALQSARRQRDRLIASVGAVGGRSIGSR